MENLCLEFARTCTLSQADILYNDFSYMKYKCVAHNVSDSEYWATHRLALPKKLEVKLEGPQWNVLKRVTQSHQRTRSVLAMRCTGTTNSGSTLCPAGDLLIAIGQGELSGLHTVIIFMNRFANDIEKEI